MNYLAHLYFSEPTPLAWAGSLMGDFVKGNDLTAYPAELTRHLKLHRHIDTYTRFNDAFQNSRRCLDVRFRYARSVLVDVFYDHLLACHWGRYHPLPLSEFAKQVYDGLEECFDLLAPGLQDQLPRMRQYDWLTSYRTEETVQRVLVRLQERIQHKFPLAEGFAELERCRPALEQDFVLFMTQADTVVQCWKDTN